MCLDAGMDDYVSKPIRVEELVQALEKCQPNREVGELRTTDSKMQPSSVVPIDAEVIQEFRATAGESASAFLAELIDCYLEETPKQLQAMKASVAQGNAKAVQQEAHTLKSSSAALGATAIANISKKLEVMNYTEINEAALEILQLEAEYQRVKVALEIERQQC